jgi:hypothetical protein
MGRCTEDWQSSGANAALCRWYGDDAENLYEMGHLAVWITSYVDLVVKTDDIFPSNGRRYVYIHVCSHACSSLGSRADILSYNTCTGYLGRFLGM